MVQNVMHTFTVVSSVILRVNHVCRNGSCIVCWGDGRCRWNGIDSCSLINVGRGNVHKWDYMHAYLVCWWSLRPDRRRALLLQAGERRDCGVLFTYVDPLINEKWHTQGPHIGTYIGRALTLALAMNTCHICSARWDWPGGKGLLQSANLPAIGSR